MSETRDLILPDGVKLANPRKIIEADILLIEEKPVQVVMENARCPSCGNGNLVNTGDTWGNHVHHTCEACGAQFAINGRGFPFINFKVIESALIPSVFVGPEAESINA